jgi:drug/metabolite transporter (DMT)-like permease
MTAPGGHHAKGVLMSLIGVLALSPDVLLIRCVDVDPWTIVFWRSFFTAVATMMIVTVATRRRKAALRTEFTTIGRPGFFVATFAAATNLLFVVSVTHTAAANTVVIFSATPLFAAGLSSVFLKDRVPLETWGTALVAAAAIAVVFSGGLAGTGGQGGNFAALACAVLAASNLTISRKHRTRIMLPAFVGSGLISAGVVAAFAPIGSMAASDALLLAIDGVLVLPVGIGLMMVAPRHIPSPDVALIYLLETVLAPFWVWLVLGEVPPKATIFGGLVLLSTLIAHVWYQSVSARRFHQSSD